MFQRLRVKKVVTPLIKSFLEEEAMQGGIEEHLEVRKEKNRKNGKGTKKVRL